MTRSYFTDDELKCPCCNEYKFNNNTRARLNKLREKLGFPIIINSGYRCERYNNLKGYTQTHETGQAVDTKIRGQKAYKLIHAAIEVGFSGIGIKQKGASRFVHLDDLDAAQKRPRPWIWSY